MLSSAQKACLLSEEEDPRDPNNVLYVGYCSNHYGKQVTSQCDFLLAVLLEALDPPLFSTFKPPKGILPHSLSVLIGNFIPVELAVVTSDLINNPQVTIPSSRSGLFLPPFSEIETMEFNGKTVTLSRDITAVTSAIRGPIPSMPSVVSGHNVVC